MWPVVQRYRARAVFALAAAALLGTIALYVVGRAPRTRATPANIVVRSTALPAWFSQGPPRRIAGQVRTAAGAGVAATVRVRLDVPDPRVWAGVDLATAVDGTFAIEKLPAGRYQLVVLGAWSSRPSAVDTRDGDRSRVAMIVAPCLERRGRVESEGADADGLLEPPIAGASIEVAGETVATTDGQGDYRWCGAAEVTVTVRAAGHLPENVAQGPGRGSGVDDVIALSPADRAPRRARVVRPDGSPWPNIAVFPAWRTEDCFRCDAQPIPALRMTDANGWVDVSGLAPPDDYRLVFTTSHHDPRYRRAAMIDDTGRIYLYDSPDLAVTVTGRVTIDGVPAPDARITSVEEGCRYDCDIFESRTDLDGTFRVRVFRSERIAVIARDPSDLGRLNVAVLTRADGENPAVHLELSPAHPLGPAMRESGCGNTWIPH